MIAEIGATPAWCEFNVRLAVEMLREAAAMTTQILGEVIAVRMRPAASP